MTGSGCALDLDGERLLLLPDRAAWSPARETLLLADAHVGKGDHFRRQGVPVPAGASACTLERLSRLVSDLGARRVVSLGDFLHATPTAAVLAGLDRWRERHAGLRVTLVPGNHDRSLAALAGGGWEISPLATMGSVRLRHEPADVSQPAICGHLHPVVRLGQGRSDRIRVPVFWLSGQQLVLPAFGEFTGGLRIRPGAADRVFAVGPDRVIEVSGLTGRRTRALSP